MICSLLTPMGVAAAPTNKVAAPLDLKIACEQQVLDLLGGLELPKKWEEVSLDPSLSPPGLRVLRTDTNNPHIHLRMVLSQERTTIERTIESDASLARTEVTGYSFLEKKKCQPDLQVRMLEGNKGPVTAMNNREFTDTDLNLVLSQSRLQHQTYLLYLWSPRMELSITGVNEVRKMAEKKKMELVVMADPMATPAAIQSVVTQNHWPEEFGKRVASEGLISHNALVHYPTLTVIREGRFAVPVRPGYDEPNRLNAWLTEVTEQVNK